MRPAAFHRLAPPKLAIGRVVRRRSPSLPPLRELPEALRPWWHEMVSAHRLQLREQAETDLISIAATFIFVPPPPETTTFNDSCGARCRLVMNGTLSTECDFGPSVESTKGRNAQIPITTMLWVKPILEQVCYPRPDMISGNLSTISGLTASSP